MDNLPANPGATMPAARPSALDTIKGGPRRTLGKARTEAGEAIHAAGVSVEKLHRRVILIVAGLILMLFLGALFRSLRMLWVNYVLIALFGLGAARLCPYPRPSVLGLPDPAAAVRAGARRPLARIVAPSAGARPRCGARALAVRSCRAQGRAVRLHRLAARRAAGRALEHADPRARARHARHPCLAAHRPPAGRRARRDRAPPLAAPQRSAGGGGPRGAGARIAARPDQGLVGE